MSSQEKALQVFNYNGARVRAVEEDGQIWWVAKDVCDILGLANARKAVNSLDDDEKMTVTKSYGHSGKRGGAQFMNVVNESGLYNLIFRSNKPEAKLFRRWVTHEVLPQIRRHGMYLTDKAAETLKNDPETFNALMANYLAEKEQNQKLREQIASDKPYTVIGKIVTNVEGCYTFKEVSDFCAQRNIDIGQNRLTRRYREKKLLCSRKGRQWNQPTHKAIEKGYFVIQFHTEDGRKAGRPRTLITSKGLKETLNELWGETFPLDALIERTQAIEELSQE